MIRKLKNSLLIAGLIASSLAFGQSAVIRGESAPGIYPNLKSDSTASLQVNTEGQKRTYWASIVGLVPAAAATDIFYISGSLGTTVRVTKLSISGTQTTGGIIDVVLIKRQVNNSGGTSSVPVKVPSFQTLASSQATVLAYTANPTPGLAIGPISSDKLLLNSTAGLANQVLVWDFTVRNTTAPAFISINQGLAINLNGQTIIGGSLNINIEWTEE